MKHLFKGIVMVVVALTMAACSTFNDDSNPYGTSEAMKDMSGVWRLKTVTRNGVEITKQMDFSKFRLHLNTDGKNRIENYLPFVVSNDGTWAVNDPQHPMQLSFKENGAAEGIDLDFNYPMSDGSRSLSITLSPGCPANSYVYMLYRENGGK